MPDDLERLAELIRVKNELHREWLLSQLRERGVKIGVATSVRKAAWEIARIFPPGPTSPLQLSESQIAGLSLFASQGSFE